MEVQRLKALRGELDVFVSRFDDCIKTVPSRRHMRTYVGGQVSHLERKNVAAIALKAGVPPRSLQEFVAIHRWGEEGVGDRVQEIVATEHADPNAIGVIHETSFGKKGDKTAGVQRQYCGASGPASDSASATRTATILPPRPSAAQWTRGASAASSRPLSPFRTGRPPTTTSPATGTATGPPRAAERSPPRPCTRWTSCSG